MLALRPVVTSLMYVPLGMVNPQLVMNQLRVRYEKQAPDVVNFEDEYKEEEILDPENCEIECFDLSLEGYIGVPRAFGIEKLGIGNFVNRTVRLRPQPELFPRKIRPRDPAQKDFMELLCSLVRGPSPVDIIANARTGTGKTVTTMYVIENAIQASSLVVVPTVYLLNQWRERIAGLMGQSFYDKYVGHIQQDTMDYEGRLITLGVAKSLAIRDYPLALRRAFHAIFIDEGHRIGVPSMQRILTRYPASVRVSMTATNRTDALHKVSVLHFGKPRAISKQTVMKPKVYIIEHRMTLPKRMGIPSENYMISILSRSHSRNKLLADLLFSAYNAGRQIVGLSDRTDQLQVIMKMLNEYGVPETDVGLLVGSYKKGGKTIKLKRAEQDRVAKTCRIRLATYGLFAEGSDIDVLDFGCELTPRINLKQSVGRVLRVLQGKLEPIWYSIKDTVMVYPDIANSELFGSEVEPVPYEPLIRDAKAREGSFRFHDAVIINAVR